MWGLGSGLLPVQKEQQMVGAPSLCSSMFLCMLIPVLSAEK